MQIGAEEKTAVKLGHTYFSKSAAITAATGNGFSRSEKSWAFLNGGDHIQEPYCDKLGQENHKHPL